MGKTSSPAEKNHSTLSSFDMSPRLSIYRQADRCRRHFVSVSQLIHVSLFCCIGSAYLANLDLSKAGLRQFLTASNKPLPVLCTKDSGRLNGILDRPFTHDAVSKNEIGQAVTLSHHHHGKSLTIVGDEMITAAFICLSLAGGPNTVARLIVSVPILPVNGVFSGRSRTHILHETGESSLSVLPTSPAQANRNSPPSITREMIHFRVLASGAHRSPDSVLTGSARCRLVFMEDEGIVSLGFSHGDNMLDSSEGHSAATGGPCAFIMTETTSKSTGRI